MYKANKTKSYQSALYERIGEKPIAYQVAFRRVLGSVNAALLMSQLLYWQGVAKQMGKESFYKTVKELEEETGLTRKEQENAIKLCEAKGVLKHWLHGIPPKRHFQVKILELKELCLVKEVPKVSQYVPLEPVQIVPNVPFNTDTTSEIKSDINKINEFNKLKAEVTRKLSVRG